MARPQIFVGRWEDIVSNNTDELAGRTVRVSIEPDDDEAARNSCSLDAAIARLNGRTQEEVLATRQRLLDATPEPRPVPPGKTLEEVIMGQWPGDETDEQIAEALRRLS